jgi:hypothetical protein
MKRTAILPVLALVLACGDAPLQPAVDAALEADLAVAHGGNGSSRPN